jgi:hypothetical protein
MEKSIRNIAKGLGFNSHFSPPECLIYIPISALENPGICAYS